MSTPRTTDTGLRVHNRGGGDRRYSKGPIHVRLRPEREVETEQRIMVRRSTDDGRTFDLFLSQEEAETVADALDDILDFLEKTA